MVERFGLTAAPERQWIWLDQPNGPHLWPLPTHCGFPKLKGDV